MNPIIIGTKRGPVDVMNLQPGDVDLSEICQTISQIGRFNGRGNKFFSVAQHSMVVYRILREQGHAPAVLLGGICHDFAEAFMGDIIAPIKRELPRWVKEAEGRAMEVIESVLPLGHWPTELVKKADGIACIAEARHLGLDTSWWDFFPIAAHRYRIGLDTRTILEMDMSPNLAAELLKSLYRDTLKEINPRFKA